jgi:flagellar biosynthesis protein FliR
MLLTKKGLDFSKNAKKSILGEVFGFWALFFFFSPGLETLKVHFDAFELL